MKVFTKYNNKIEKERDILYISRRRFFKNMGMLAALYLIPLSACRRWIGSDEKRPNEYNLSKKEKQILIAVMLHLLPADGEGPDAIEINAPDHFNFVMSDKHLQNSKRKLLLSGISWTEDTANELFKASFIDLNFKQKEEVLRDLESYSNGEKWLSRILNYIFEALLGAPAYGVNKNQTGWKWLDHSPGFPQPTPDNIYGTYGYGL